MRQRYVFIVVLLLFASVFTHKIATLFASGCLVALSAAELRSNRSQHSIILLLVAMLLLWIQWVYLSSFSDGIVLRAQAALAALDGGGGTNVYAPVATQIHTGILGKVHTQSDVLGLGLVAGVTWLFLALRYRDDSNVVFILVLSAGAVAATFAAVVGGSSLAPSRFVYFSEIAFAIMAGTIIALLSSHESITWRSVGIVVLVVALASQLVVVGALPGDPSTTRATFTEAEQEARGFSEFTNRSVHTDFMYYATSREFDNSFASWGEGLLAGEVPTNTTVAHRPGLEVYHGTGGTGDWLLHWSPEEEIESSCNKLYDNDAVTYNNC